MSFHIYNTLTRRLQAFKPLKSGESRIYSCGPTVYDFPHIGNSRAYIFSDLLRRWLEFRGFKVVQVMNLTDVDDKIIKRSHEAGIKLRELTDKYAAAFFEDIKLLKIRPAMIYSRATEHISDMIELIKKLVSSGLAYVSEDGVYFSIGKFKPYGKLSKIKLGAQKEEQYSRVMSDQYEKNEICDFALWKFWRTEDGDVKWDSPWGAGRPGWHIECSAMSMKYLGDTFDIHTGGIDLAFPHHENEIAQSTGSTGKPFVNYWVHSEHLLVNGQKMSKSLGNIITLSRVIEEGYSPLALRYFLLSGHYRTQMNFTWDALRHAREAVDKVNDFASKVCWLLTKVQNGDNKGLVESISKAIDDFKNHLDDDLNAPEALASFYHAIAEVNKAIDAGKAGKNSLAKMQQLLELFNSVFDVIEPAETKISDDDLELIEERERLRRQKKFKEADLIRENLHKRGITLEDTPYGIRWKIARLT